MGDAKPWRYTQFFNAPEATAVDAPLTAMHDAPSDEAEESSPKEATEITQTTATTQTSPLKNTSNNKTAPQRKGVWMPPSQNVEQRRGKIFSIQEPQDLFDFVVEDERLSVVKVYASWCKTCKVFDIRYRKLASQLGDKYNDSETGKSNEITQKGRVRFAEMQYDNPNNEEMCILLNATKLPYILMYKGSKGKVKDFQCSPAKFQLLINDVNELADPAVVEEGVVANGNNDGEVNAELNQLSALNDDALATSPETTDTTSTSAAEDPPSNGEETINSLQQQLVTLENEKVEMFEIMKAQIEHDKMYIQKLETGVETQRSMLEAKDGEITELQSTLKSKEEGIQSLTTNLNQQQEKTKLSEKELVAYQTEVSQLINTISQIEETIKSIELESSVNEKAAQEKEQQLLRQKREWEEQKNVYEKERNSLRQLVVLGVKRVGRGARSFVSRVKQKKIELDQRK
eukprot:CAMPEP_0172305536 /NCGR_PEP_ID=MMETSP1058-20130122/6792_1 /TAXON_ID=83371 /ORGANISM="Detonula confervacea, Strain CCMP 353" /LENGTH=458 /DNA_ID=CAMNT_0013017157 /DNA_START=337 /DNA_END=1714 /DNA_ORIENTATION=+